MYEFHTFPYLGGLFKKQKMKVLGGDINTIYIMTHVET